MGALPEVFTRYPQFEAMLKLTATAVKNVKQSIAELDHKSELLLQSGQIAPKIADFMLAPTNSAVQLAQHFS